MVAQQKQHWDLWAWSKSHTWSSRYRRLHVRRSCCIQITSWDVRPCCFNYLTPLGEVVSNLKRINLSRYWWKRTIKLNNDLSSFLTRHIAETEWQLRSVCFIHGLRLAPVSHFFCTTFVVVLPCCQLYMLSSFQPITPKQIAKRNRSSINMKNFKKFNARRKWKVSLDISVKRYFKAYFCALDQQ